MFESLSGRLASVLDRLRGKGALTGADVETAMRDVRVALLEADVALPVVKDFIAKTKEKLVGAEIVKSVSPSQMVIKLVHDSLTEMLGAEFSGLNLAAVPPVVIMAVGLQGSGKTTSCGKLALRLKNKMGKKPLLASLDVYRPAAQKQLEVLAGQTGVESLEIIEGEKPEAITRRALSKARLEGFDVLILDTAGRLHVDEELMTELEAVKALSSPAEIMLVADSLTGQDAVNIAKTFNERIGITGIMLTRADGDAKGGAALSMKFITGRPVKFLGVGEKPEDIEEFHPERAAGRILDKGDIVSLVEKAVEAVDKDEAEQMEAKLRKGSFDLEDMARQFKYMKKMGGVSAMMGMLPGMGRLKEKMGDSAEADLDKTMLNRQEAIIFSMTPAERKNPKILNHSRKKRVAAGAGVEVQDINRLLKQHQQMSDMMKQLSRMGGKAFARSALGGLLGKGR